MPGTDSNSGRCSSLYHLLNSCTCWVSISTYTMKIPRPFCAMCPYSLRSVAAIVLPRLFDTGPHVWSPGETRDTNWGTILTHDHQRTAAAQDAVLARVPARRARGRLGKSDAYSHRST